VSSHRRTAGGLTGDRLSRLPRRSPSHFLALYSPDVGAYHEVETPKGSVMVSADLLTPSSNEYDEDSGTPSYSSESTEAIASPPSNASSRIPGYHTPSHDGVETHIQPISAAYHEVPTFGSTSPLNSQTRRPEKHRLETLEKLSCGPTQFVATTQACNVPDQEPLGPGILPFYVNPHTTLSTPYQQTHPIRTASPNGDCLAPGNCSFEGTNQAIPSYMSPEAIRARNIILSCNLPRRRNKPIWNQYPAQQEMFTENFHSPKRQKMDGE